MVNKDILYITEFTIRKMYELCDVDLVKKTLCHFHQVGEIVIKNDNEKPSKWWIITNYITNNTIEERHLLSVILSFAHVGGYIQINERIELGYEKVLEMLKGMYYISDYEYDYFLEIYSKLKNGEKIKFTL